MCFLVFPSSHVLKMVGLSVFLGSRLLSLIFVPVEKSMVLIFLLVRVESMV